MSRRMGLMLAVACACGVLALCVGCREDLIDQTPVNEVGAAGLDAQIIDAAGVPEAPPMKPVPEEAETAQAADPSASEGFRADAPAAGTSTDAARSSRPRRGSSAGAPAPAESGGDGGAQAAPARPAQPSRRSNGGASSGNGGGSGGQQGEGRRQSPFERLDGNGDGLLQRAEIPEATRDRFMQADSNGDGAISQEEMRAAMPPRGGGGAGGPGGGEALTPEQRRARMMERMDPDGDGKVTLAEMPERMRERMKAIDTNGDGVLSEQEFEKAREAWGQRRGGGGGQGGFGGRRGSGEQRDGD